MRHDHDYDYSDRQDTPIIRELSSTTPTAQKDYECTHCHTTIKKGEKHRKYVFLDDTNNSNNPRGFSSTRSHIICPIVGYGKKVV